MSIDKSKPWNAVSCKAPDSEGLVRLERAFLRPSDGEEPNNFAAFNRRSTRFEWEHVTGESVPVDDRGLKDATRHLWVIVGPSGAGKTSEMRQRAEILRERGVLSFFLSAATLAEGGVEEVLSHGTSIGTIAEFKAWRLGDDRAVFFVDALDEAVRVTPEARDMVIRRLKEAVAGVEHRMRLVLSTRIGFWTIDDSAAFGSILPRPLEIAHRDADKPEKSIDDVHPNDSIARHPVSTREQPGPLVEVQLAPLDNADAIRLAQAWNVGDADSFAQALDQNEVIAWKLLPAQLRVLVDYFRDHGRFGTWSEMLEAVIEASLRERNRMHGHSRRLTRSESWFALERLAAALVLGKKLDLAVPGSPCPPGAVDIEGLLDWERPKLREVLDLGLFEGTARATARFRTRPMADFLAGRWLASRGQTNWQAKVIRDQLVVTTYPGSRRRIPAPLGPVAGWVAVSVPLVRAALLQHAPHLVLVEGDPCAVPIVALREAIRRFCEDQARGRWKTMWPTPGTCHQLGRCDVGDVIVELLGVHRAHRGTLLFLLHVVRFGRLEVCAAAALNLALDRTCPRSVRVAAIYAVGAAGSNAERTCLADRMRLRKHVRGALKAPLIRTLFGREWHVDDLVQIAGVNPRRDVQLALGTVVGDVPQGEIVRLLEIAAVLTEDGPAWGALCLARLVLRVLVEIPDPAWPLTLGAHLTTLDEALQDVFDDDIYARLHGEMTHRRTARQQFVKAFASAQRSRHSDLPIDGRRRLLHLGLEDLAFLVEFYLEDSGRMDIAFAIRKLVTSHGEEEALRALGVAELEKQAVVRHFGLRTANEQAPPPFNRHAAMQAEAMAKSRIALLERLGAIADGTEGSALAWLCGHVDGPGTKYGAASLTRIRRDLGDKVADAMVEGLQRFWRKNRPPAPEPGSNSTPYVAIIGLRGLELEAGRGGFFNGLSAEDATTAAWFAMHEINGLPPWFDRLLAEHPQSVRPVLTTVIQHEWDTPTKCYGLLASALHESQRIQAVVAEVAAFLVLREKPGNPTALSDSLSVILAQRGAQQALGIRLRQLVEEFEREGAEDYIVACLRAWSHVAPADVLRWLERSGDGSSATAERRVLSMAETLGEDVDERAMRRGRTMMEIDTWRPAVVARWIRLVFCAVPTKTDRVQDRSRKGAEMYAVQPRDYAERFRDHLFYMLGKNTTAEARQELRRLRHEPVLGNRLRAIPRMLQWQGETIANKRMRPWTEQEIAKFENQDESLPRDTGDLLALIRRHIEGIAEEVERGDFRFTALFTKLGKGDPRVAERDVQLWLAQTLKLASRGLYEVTREPEVDARKKPDISATTGGCSRVPIEIKPADWYSLRELEDCLQEQLIGQYMRPESVRHGVLVIASLGVKRTWKLSARPGDFRELCTVLQRRADRYAVEHALEEIAVVGIRLAE